MNANINYAVWNIKSEFTFIETACLWIETPPPLVSDKAVKVGLDVMELRVISSKLQQKEKMPEFKVIANILQQAVEDGRLKCVSPPIRERKILGYDDYGYPKYEKIYDWDTASFRREDLKAFAESIGQRPKFLFPEPQKENELHQGASTESVMNEADFDGFMRGLKVFYESDNEIRIQVPGQKAKCFNCEALGFRDNSTAEWQTLLDILRTPSLAYSFGPAYTYSEDGAGKIKKANREYSAARKRIEEISKKLVAFFGKQYNFNAPKNYTIYESMRGRAGTVQLKFKQETLEQVFAAPIDGGYNGYRREDILKNLKELANDKKTPDDYLAERIEEAKLRGVSNEELEDILPPSRSALLTEN